MNYMLNGKVMIIPLTVGLIQNTLYKMSQYFPEPSKTFRELRELMIKLIYLIMQQK